VGECADKLLGFMRGAKGYEIPYDEVRALQLAAVHERFREQAGRTKLVGLRARDANITELQKFEDIVPLLLPHTAYKSYPESYLLDGRWDKLTRWLGTVSAHPLENINLEGIGDIDDWIARLESAGHLVSCSSGTTGKAAMLIASQADMEAVCLDNVTAFAWGSGVAPAQDRKMFGLAPMAQVPRNTAVSEALKRAFGLPGVDRFIYPVPPITIGSITRMIALRKSMSAGTARPGDIAEFEATSAARQAAVDAAVGLSAEALIAARNEKLYIAGMWASVYRIAEEVRARGFSGDDFRSDNTIYVAGGLKGAQLPANYREYVYETFNLQPERNYQMYSMQEINTAMPRCQQGGRYHIPPWLICLPLDKSGEQLLPVGKGEVEGRAAFFDLSMDGRWGGIISGDRIEIDYGPCTCGAASPSIRDNVVRFSDLEGDDKINCSGTIDAYVRGLT
jgi:hypothetical protein